MCMILKKDGTKEIDSSEPRLADLVFRTPSLKDIPLLLRRQHPPDPSATPKFSLLGKE